MNKVTIHQPDFLPWLGFFSKLNKSDVFVNLDHVVNNPRDGFWGRRVKIMGSNEPVWLTMPLKKDKERVFVPINEMELNINEKFVSKTLKTLEQSYKKAPFFEKYFYLVEDYFDPSQDDLLAKRNLKFIKSVCNILEINTQFVNSSDYNLQFTSNELLIELIKIHKGEVYVCGDGAGGYQKNELFQDSGIQIEYNNFTPQKYLQHKSDDFYAGLSVIDALFNIGEEEIKANHL